MKRPVYGLVLLLLTVSAAAAAVFSGVSTQPGVEITRLRYYSDIAPAVNECLCTGGGNCAMVACILQNSYDTAAQVFSGSVKVNKITCTWTESGSFDTAGDLHTYQVCEYATAAGSKVGCLGSGVTFSFAESHSRGSILSENVNEVTSQTAGGILMVEVTAVVDTGVDSAEIVAPHCAVYAEFLD